MVEFEKGQSTRDLLEKKKHKRIALEKRRARNKRILFAMGAIIAAGLIALLALTALNAHKARIAAEEHRKEIAEAAAQAAAKIHAEQHAREAARKAMTEEERVADDIVQTIAPAFEDPNKVTLTAVGDNLIHGSVYTQAAERYAAAHPEEEADEDGTEPDVYIDPTYDFVPCYEKIAPFIRQHDLNWINMETIITDELGPSSYPEFATPTASALALIDAGWNVFSLSSNHTYDYNDEGVGATLRFWNSNLIPQNVITTGIWEDKSEIPIIESKGHKIAFLSYTYGATHGIDGLYGGVVFLSKEETIREQLALAREQADCVVVAAHWGNEYALTPSDDQRDMAHALADWGADLIIGAHPHVVQDGEWIETEDGRKVFCAYSLGNFLSGQREAVTQVELMLDVTLAFDDDAKDGVTVRIEDPHLIPMVNVYGAEMADIHTEFLQGYTPERAAAHGCLEFDDSFSYDFIIDLLTEHVSSDFLVLPE